MKCREWKFEIKKKFCRPNLGISILWVTLVVAFIEPPPLSIAQVVPRSRVSTLTQVQASASSVNVISETGIPMDRRAENRASVRARVGSGDHGGYAYFYTSLPFLWEAQDRAIELVASLPTNFFRYQLANPVVKVGLLSVLADVRPNFSDHPMRLNPIGIEEPLAMADKLEETSQKQFIEVYTPFFQAFHRTGRGPRDLRDAMGQLVHEGLHFSGYNEAQARNIATMILSYSSGRIAAPSSGNTPSSWNTMVNEECNKWTPVFPGFRCATQDFNFDLDEDYVPYYEYGSIVSALRKLPERPTSNFRLIARFNYRVPVEGVRYPPSHVGEALFNFTSEGANVEISMPMANYLEVIPFESVERMGNGHRVHFRNGDIDVAWDVGTFGEKLVKLMVTPSWYRYEGIFPYIHTVFMIHDGPEGRGQR